MERSEAIDLIKQYVKNPNSIKHMLATEAIMAALAEYFGQDKELWARVGLLHDLDMELVDYQKEPERHGLVSAEILNQHGLEPVIIEAIKAHNPLNGKEPVSQLEKAIYCVDPLSGLIVAATLVLPSKKLADLSPESVLRRYREKAFARGANRQAIAACSQIGLSLEEFVKIGLKAMQGISQSLGL